ncbi:hypothetical protein EJ05DRAFT_360588 [Pseudovirgaria hyperparasitica]|uniref:Uncharacterized protein n=1 Tax=Pseudovirgaria hyperparasitica TaxID=470096 RepID=A0A6A6W9V0_9PEZI|nr:uncharacterized protein EJ05DRAFT_360588 [Pseudovirgaria hyperparasitica]KAF2758656.1 hypothetical protein EJ05DRAFT_360588 [Pseudovirgaria hyperparasitica]
MHRTQPLAALVYQHIFPVRRPDDPANFSMHLSKNLVGEVRIETATFYGSLDSVEARYPGLNYSHPPHRKRLGRFPHHARLFQAFDELGLTPSEIAGFCRWEGTLWARERYERDEGIKVMDTTAQEIGPWVDNRNKRSQKSGINVKTDIEVEIMPAQTAEVAEDETMEDNDDEHNEVMSEAEDETADDVFPQDVHRGTRSAQIDAEHAEWEQYMKDQQERERRELAGEIVRARQTGDIVFQQRFVARGPPTAS